MSKKNNLMLRFASLLLVCVLVSTYALCGLLAKYATSGSSGDDARVIEFKEFTLFDPTEQSIIAPGVDIIREVIVDFNGSEASTYVFVEMELGGTWVRTPGVENVSGDAFSFNSSSRSLLSFEIDKQWKYVKQEGNSYVYYQELKPNTPLEAHVLKNDAIVVSPDIITIDINGNVLTNGDLSLLQKISMEFSAIVVQSHGFDSLDDAWTSVNP